MKSEEETKAMQVIWAEMVKSSKDLTEEESKKFLNILSKVKKTAKGVTDRMVICYSYTNGNSKQEYEYFLQEPGIRTINFLQRLLKNQLIRRNENV